MNEISEPSKTAKMSREDVYSYLTGPARQLQLVVEDTVTSTNDLLKIDAANHVPSGKAIVAAHQTAGKGRRGRSFYSPDDTGLYLSLLVRPDMSAEDSLSLTTAAAVAVCKAIETVLGVETSIKWVNDVYCRGRKVTGILTEAGTIPGQGSKLSWAVIGIGVNVWAPKGGFPEDIRHIAGALLEPDQRRDEPIRSRLAAAILNEYMEIYPDLLTRHYMDEYRRRSFVVGKTVRLMDVDHKSIEDQPPVTVTGIGDRAELIVKEPDGHVRTINSGEVSLLLD